MKNLKIIFWTSTTFIFLFQGVMPALTAHTEMAKEGITQLGYPVYFGVALSICKVMGAIILLFPQFPARLKEWAYAGFTFDFVFAAISLYIVNGPGPTVFYPLLILGVLMLSYVSYHRIVRTYKPIDYDTQAV